MQSPPPLCEFIDYMDLEQSPEDIAEVERIAREVRERWRAMEQFDIFMQRSNQLCGRRRSSGASAKLHVSKVRRKHESALKTASVAKERNVRLRGTGCARELVALGNLER